MWNGRSMILIDRIYSSVTCTCREERLEWCCHVTISLFFFYFQFYSDCRLFFLVVSLLQLTVTKGDASFHSTIFDNSDANWDVFYDHIRDALWKDISKLSASAAASEFYKWVHVGIDVCILFKESIISNIDHISFLLCS